MGSFCHISSAYLLDCSIFAFSLCHDNFVGVVYGSGLFDRMDVVRYSYYCGVSHTEFVRVCSVTVK